MWYVFVVLNTCQGLFIFVAFSCTKKFWKELRKKNIPPTQTVTSNIGTSGSENSGIRE
jgi:hypothetical protein